MKNKRSNRFPKLIITMNLWKPRIVILEETPRLTFIRIWLQTQKEGQLIAHHVIDV